MAYFTIDNVKDFMYLFHAAPKVLDDKGENISSKTLVNKGIIFVENGEICTEVPKQYAEIASKLFAVSNEDWSKSFHKTWDKVAESDIMDLLFEQTVHYFSTYGLEMFGLEARPVIPAEKIVTDPEQMPNFKAFTVIEFVTEEVAIDMITNYVKTVVSPHSNLVSGIISLMQFTDVSADDLISFELKCARCKQLGTVPTDGQDFIRYSIYTLTGNTLVVKSYREVKHLKRVINARPNDAYELLSVANEVELAKVFYRNKNIILAFKESPECAPIVNRVRRLATKHHMPLSDVSVRNASMLARQGRVEDLNRVLSKASMRTLIKLYNYAKCETETSVYNIRNGKLFVNSDPVTVDNTTLLSIVSNKIVENLQTNTFGGVTGKIFYIPSYIKYTAPVSEKQMIGSIPYGSKVSSENPGSGFCLAIKWDNYQKCRTDIDLHMQSGSGELFGWNSQYRNDGRTVLYSGDMTDASNGAVEAFNFEPITGESYILTANNFTSKPDVPFEFFMTEKGFNSKKKARYTDVGVCDVEDALFTPVPLKFNGDQNSTSIGILKDSAFYFYGGNLGVYIIPKRELYSSLIEALEARLSSMVTLDKILTLAGATVVDETALGDLTDEEKAEVVDLSPACITEHTLIDLVDKLDLI